MIHDELRNGGHELNNSVDNQNELLLVEFGKRGTLRESFWPSYHLMQ